MQQNDYVTIGANANLRKIAPFLGTLSVSRTNNKYTGSTYTNVDYDQSLLANRYATVSLRAGIQNYQYNNHENLRDKYVNIDVSIPSLPGSAPACPARMETCWRTPRCAKALTTALLPVGASVSKQIKQNKMTIAAIVPTITPPMVTSAMTPNITLAPSPLAAHRSTVQTTA